MDITNTPAALIDSSKQKYTLSQSRLRRDWFELSLVSLHASLEDGLRSFLLLQQLPAERGDWQGIIERLSAYERRPLSAAEVDRLHQIHALHTRITRGESVTLSADSVLHYRQFAARLLIRYGVLVVEPASDTPLRAQSPGDPSAASSLSGARRLWQRTSAERNQRTLLVLLVLLASASLTLALVNRWQPLEPFSRPSAAADAPANASPPAASPTASSSSRLAPGTLAYVVADLEGQPELALQATPGNQSVPTIRLSLAPGTAVDVLAGPVLIDGAEWWQVRAFNIDGWCAARWLEVR